MTPRRPGDLTSQLHKIQTKYGGVTRDVCNQGVKPLHPLHEAPLWNGVDDVHEGSKFGGWNGSWPRIRGHTVDLVEWIDTLYVT